MSPDLPAYDRRTGAGPTMVFLHYWGGSARTWSAVSRHLPGRDMLLMDFRGWSRSRHLPGPFTLARYADDVLAVLRDAAIADAVLVGHSMGGKVAQLVAGSDPAGLCGIVLVAPGPAVPAPHVTPAHRRQLSRAYDDVASVAHARDQILTASALPDELARQVVIDSRCSAAGAAAEWPLHGIAEDISSTTRRITVPSLVVAGGKDQVEPPDVLRSNLLPHLQGSELAVVATSGHLLPLEAPQELASLIAGFVDSLPSPLARSSVSEQRRPGGRTTA